MEHYQFAQEISRPPATKKKRGWLKRTCYLVFGCILFLHVAATILRAPIIWRDWQMSKLNRGDNYENVTALLGEPDYSWRVLNGNQVYVYYGGPLLFNTVEFRQRWSVEVDSSNRVVSKTRSRFPTRC